uniref:Uncharacterized protein n=1 Tax=Marseillevirus sp. TaxID=2809551 RepID=A0AA96ENU3_9VIRU|nr:hypothetical protein MarFTMF_428 [Marseillevirus sp.]
MSDRKSKAPGTIFLTRRNFWRILEDGDSVKICVVKAGDLCFCFWGSKGKF